MNQNDALAIHLGMDSQELRDYRYQPKAGEKVQVYAIGDKYFCAIHGIKKPPTGFDWTARRDSYMSNLGWLFWETTEPKGGA